MERLQLKFNKTLKIIVKANSKKNEIKGFDNRKRLRVNIKVKAEHNKANIEIIKLFSRLTKKKVRIVKGLTSKEKILKIV